MIFIVMNLKKYIRNILREETVKKFDKEDVNRGKFSDVLEKMVIDYVGKENICDVIAVYSQKYYIILVLYNGPSPWSLARELNGFIKKIVPFELFVMITDTECDEK